MDRRNFLRGFSSLAALLAAPTEWLIPRASADTDQGRALVVSSETRMPQEIPRSKQALWRSVIDLRVSESQPVKTVICRPIWNPVKYYEAAPMKQNAGGYWYWENFPDEHLYPRKRFTRICGDDLSTDYWKQSGFRVSPRYLANMIVRTPEGSSVEVLSKGRTVFDQLFILENTIGKFLGGADGCEIAITARYSQYTRHSEGNVIYEACVTKKNSPVTDHEQRLLAAVHQPTIDEYRQMIREDEAWLTENYGPSKWGRPRKLPKGVVPIRTLPIWMLSGYPLEKMCQPTPLRIG